MRTLIALALLGGAQANGRHDANGDVIASLAPEELAVSASGHLGDRPPSYDMWSTGDRSGPPPYPYPADRTYNTKGGPKEGMINVHLVPHTHDDTGWQVTVDQYFEREVYFIVDTIAQQLAEDPNRKFIYVETAFFARWWEQASDAKRDRMKKLVAGKQLEFINGGWCMHDEASPLWTAMVDQTTRGHQFLLKHFGPEANPRGTWQIDPFGHSNTEAWLLGAEAGMESLFWGRMDYEDRDMRFGLDQTSSTPEKPTTGGFEWIWEGSKSLGASAQVFAGNLYGTGQGGYSTWMNFDGSDDQINDDPRRHDYNVDRWVDKFVQDARAQAAHTLTDHQLWACGTDFQYQNADHWFRNLDKLMHYVNLNGSVNAFYSTPTIYTDWKHRNKSVVYEVRTDDIFPLADNAHDYWSGYFTSRPALKRQVRFATNLLSAARLLEVATNTTAAEVGRPTAKASPVVGDSWTDSLEGTVGVATHHDGMSGTERQDVTDDYEQRISESSFEVEAGVAASLAKLLKVDKAAIAHCNCNAAGDCLNMTVCAATTDAKSGFTIAAFNPLGQAQDAMLRVPVGVAGHWTCDDASGAPAPTQALPLDDRTKQLPLLYVNAFNMTLAEVAEEKAKLANKAVQVLAIRASLPAVGLTTLSCAPTPAAPRYALSDPPVTVADNADGTTTVANGFLELTFADKALVSLKNLDAGISTKLTATWGWYNSSVGGCTEYPDYLPKDVLEPPCSGQASGAYMFRPNSSKLFGFDPAFEPTMEVEKGALVAEVRLASADWASHVVRLRAGARHVEVEWTAGPIPVDTPWFPPVAFEDGDASKPLPNNWGKELVLKYASDLASAGTFFTDSNGKEMVERVRDARGPSYPHPYNISEPVAGNYYPVNALIALDDGANELSVVVDASLGGASVDDGSLELMVHRRLQADDNRGVQEPLNETMCGCNDVGAAPGSMGAHGHEGDGGCDCEGLAVRGVNYVVFAPLQDAHELRRELSETINFPPTLAFAPKDAAPTTYSLVSEALPKNVKLVTLTSNYAAFNGGAWLLRLSHLYEAGEQDTLAVPVEVDLEKIFAEAGLTIKSAVETSLTANGPLDLSKKLAWKSEAKTEAQRVELDARAELSFTERVAFAYPKVTIRPMEVRTFLAKFE